MREVSQWLSTTAKGAHSTRFSTPIFSSMALSRLWIYFLSRTAVKRPFVSDAPRRLHKSGSDARTVRRVYFYRRSNFAVQEEAGGGVDRETVWSVVGMEMSVPRLAAALTLLAGAILFMPLPAEAQQAGEVRRVGYINPGYASDPVRLRRFEAFRQRLRELGYVEGRNIALEPRWAEGKYDRYPALAADLVRLKVHVIVAVGGRATQVAQQATKTTPIVMSVVIDPLGSGLVSSLARPGGNVTGLTVMASDLVGKQFELLKQAVPEVSRVALLWNPANPGGAQQLREAEAAARALGVRLQTLEARDPQEIDSAFAAMTRERAGALVVLPDAIFGNQRRQIAELATK